MEKTTFIYVCIGKKRDGRGFDSHLGEYCF